MSGGSSEQLVRESLLEIESSDLIAEEPGIGSVTFFTASGSSSSTGNPVDKAASQLKGRLRKILDANPWLTGVLTRGKKEKLTHLEHLPKNSPISDEIVDEIFRLNPPGVKLNREMSYDLLCDTMANTGMLVKQGKEITNKKGRVMKVTLVSENADNTKFALVVSISHSVADGHTYYKILNMLSSDSEIKSLSSVRKHEQGPIMDAAMGKEDNKFLFSFPVMINYLWRLFFRPKTRTYGFFLDDAKVSEAKASAKKAGAEFVSTNDVITSSFSNLVDVRLCLMAINYRGKLDGLDDLDAGCYEGAILLDKDVYSSPSGVRNMLNAKQPYCGHKRPLPGMMETIACRMAWITNWASFAKNLKVEGFEQEMQIPCVPPSSIPYDVAVIFKVKGSKLGLLWLTKDYKAEDLIRAAPVGKSISNLIFPDP